MEETVHAPPPACFRCPISLEVMQDPVSLCSGVSYERSNIQRWLQDHNTCPSTSQQLASRDLIPNHTLRRLIRHWLAINSSPDPLPGTTNRTKKLGSDSRVEQVERLIEPLLSGRVDRPVSLLRQLRHMAKESATSSRVIGESEDAVPVLASIVASRRMDWSCREEALATLVLIPLTGMKRRMLASNRSFVSGVCSVLRNGSGAESRMNAAALVESLVGTDRDLKITVGSEPEGFNGLVELLRCCSNPMAVRASLRTLLALCSARRNRIRAVESGVAEALVEILPEMRDTSTCENALAVMEMICRCAEGRAAVCEIPGGIGVIAGKILAVSDLGTECTVRTLWAMCKHCESEEGRIQRRLVEAGVVPKLLLMLQMDFSSATKHNLRHLLKLLCNIQEHCPDVVLHDRIHLVS